MAVEKMHDPEWLQVYQKDNSLHVAVIVHIRNNATGEVQPYYTSVPADFYGDEGKVCPSLFHYEENNGSCDCNRHYLFDDAKGVDSGVDVECGDQVAYSICIQNPVTEKFIYEEFDKEGKPIDPPYHFLDNTQQG